MTQCFYDIVVYAIWDEWYQIYQETDISRMDRYINGNGQIYQETQCFYDIVVYAIWDEWFNHSDFTFTVSFSVKDGNLHQLSLVHILGI